MSLTFIIFGLVLIFYIFGVARASNFFRLALIIFSLIFVLVGYFVGTISTSIMTINLFHLSAFVLFSILFFDKKFFHFCYVPMLMLFVVTMILYFDRGYLLFYTGVLYFLTTAMIFIFYNSKSNTLMSLLSVFSACYLVIDGVFQYFELQYIFIDFDFIFLVLFFLYAISKIIVYLDVNNSEFKGKCYGK